MFRGAFFQLCMSRGRLRRVDGHQARVNCSLASTASLITDTHKFLTRERAEHIVLVATEIATERVGTGRDGNGQGTL